MGRPHRVLSIAALILAIVSSATCAALEPAAKTGSIPAGKSDSALVDPGLYRFETGNFTKTTRIDLQMLRGNRYSVKVETFMQGESVDRSGAAGQWRLTDSVMMLTPETPFDRFPTGQVEFSPTADGFTLEEGRDSRAFKRVMAAASDGKPKVR